MSLATINITTTDLTDYEIERGKPMPDLSHSIIQANLLLEIQPKYKGQYRLLPEVTLDMERERVPDIAIYPPKKFDPDNNQVRMTEMPLGAIEILSEMQSPQELLKKRKEYFNAGVKSYWIILPAFRTIYVYSAIDKSEIFRQNDILKDEVLGIEIELDSIFQ